MSLLQGQVQQAEDLNVLWRQRREQVRQLWSDGRQQAFDRLCDEELAQLLRRHAGAAAQLDEQLTAAMRLMLSVPPGEG